MTVTVSRSLAILAAFAAAALLALGVAPGADAKRAHKAADRNHDRIPDSWERSNHLSLRVNQAKRDQDHDGLRNLQEYQAGDNPRSADTDGDGTNDSSEGAGKVKSLDGTKLTITLFNGDDVTATLDPTTELECSGAGDQSGDNSSAARASSDGADDNENESNQVDDGAQGDDDQGEDDQGENDRQQPGCDASLLTAGRVVREAEADATSGGLVWHKVDIVR
jgi:hypothetical protein